jgi:CDP-glucose 4,6-dehydratase
MFAWRDRSVLVTGATGIVGAWLCETLLSLGASVAALVLDDDPRSRFFSDGISERCAIVNGNLADVAACSRALNLHEVDVVFHLGAQTIVGAALRDPLECLETNVRGTYNLLEAARRLPGLATRIVVASSDKAYGESPVLPYTEEMPLRGRHPYDVSKSCADLISIAYSATYGLPIAVARCGNIYGGGDLNWSRIVPGTIRSLARNGRPILRSDGSPTRDYLFVCDVVSAYIALAEQLDRSEVVGQAFNFGPQSEISAIDMVRAIQRAMNVDTDPQILGTAKFEINRQTLDSTKARELLGWTAAYTLERGLRETVDWYVRYLNAN